MLNWRELHLTTLNPCSSDEDLWFLEWSHQHHCWRRSGDLFLWAPWSHTRKDRSEIQSEASPSLWPLIITFKSIWWLFVFYCYILSTIIFCNWMHVLLFFQLIQSKRDWVGYLGAPAHWNRKWHSTVSSHGPGWAEVALLSMRSAAMWRAPVPAGWRNLQQLCVIKLKQHQSLTPLLQNPLKTSSHFGAWGWWKGPSSFRMRRSTGRDPPGHLEGQTSVCTRSIWRKHLLFCKPWEIANVWLHELMKEGCLLSTSACLNFGYLLNTFFRGLEGFPIAQEEPNILFCAC